MKKKASKPTRPGYTWVEDPTVQGGGFWRKLPGGGMGTAIAAGLGVAAVGGLAAVNKSEQEKSAVALEDLRNLLREQQTLNNVKGSPNSGVNTKTAIATGAAGLGIGVITARKLKEKKEEVSLSPEKDVALEPEKIGGGDYTKAVIVRGLKDLEKNPKILGEIASQLEKEAKQKHKRIEVATPQETGIKGFIQRGQAREQAMKAAIIRRLMK